MAEGYKILWKCGTGELTEKKSRFLAFTCPVHSEEEAAAFLEGLKKQYWDASHHCIAYVIGERNQIQRCSDDGEPSQTAGRPMLDVLLGEEIHDACVVVIRYFGGTLLGTGGLVRAYSGAAKEGLLHSTLLRKRQGLKLEVDTDYNGIGKIQYILATNQITTLNTEYTEKVLVTVLADPDRAEALKTEIAEATGGRAVCSEKEKVSYGLDGSQVIFLAMSDG